MDIEKTCQAEIFQRFKLRFSLLMYVAYHFVSSINGRLKGGPRIAPSDPGYVAVPISSCLTAKDRSGILCLVTLSLFDRTLIII